MSRCWVTRSARLWPTCCSTSRVCCCFLVSYFARGLSCFAYSLGRPENHVQLGEALGALTTLSFSSNLELQRSAALTFAEITEKGIGARLLFVRALKHPHNTEGLPVEREFLQPILHLVRSTDTEVQRAASAALGNLAVNGVCLLCFAAWLCLL